MWPRRYGRRETGRRRYLTPPAYWLGCWCSNEDQGRRVCSGGTPSRFGFKTRCRSVLLGLGPTPLDPSAACFGCGGGSGWSSRLAVRTGRLRPSRAVHFRPIDLVVFQEPSELSSWKPGLGGGFALRCLQRLSGPDLATRRCPERDSRHTRGRSSPILSY